MTSATFDRIVREQIDACTSMLLGKAAEYANDDERLHNFKVASTVQSCTLAQALGGMMCKHTTSIYDMIRSGRNYPLEKWNEKITDHINYLLILAAVVREDDKTEPAKEKAPIIPCSVHTDGMPYIVAVDFDGCLCSNKWPEIGEPNIELITALARHREDGGVVILWTCREGIKLWDAIQWCNEHGLTFDAVNANTPEQTKFFGNDCRKVGADLYMDDKAITVKA